MTEAMQRLLERLQTGWAPNTDEIDRDIRQRDLIDWWFVPGHAAKRLRLFGDELADMTGEVLIIDQYLTWALCDDGFWWLYTAEEGEKMRYLGG
jgi:hypothetical protein